MPKKTTILDVAKAAEVSIATVSRVLNNPQSVKDATRLRVQKAFADVGYAVDPALAAAAPPEKEPVARAASKMILTIVPDLSNPFYADVLEGIGSAADYQGYESVIYRVKESRYSLKQLRRLVDKLNVCGVLLLGKVAAPCDLEQLNEYVPVVQCAEFDSACNLPYVSIDDYAAAKTAMKLLIQNGRKRIALANGPQQFKYAMDRERGYYDALREAGLEIDESLVVHQSAIEFELAMSIMTQLVTKEKRLDAVFAVSDVLAVAAIKAANRAGLRVPQDIAVVGFDNTYIAQMCEPALTTVRQRGAQMGSYACEILLDLVHGVTVSHPQILMDVDLLVREST